MKWYGALLGLVAAAIGVMITFPGGDWRREADLVIISSDPLHNLDPQRSSWLTDLRVLECLYEPLVRMKLPQVTVEPAAAERWQISEDRKTYTFHIRQDAMWSNGDQVTSKDFVYGWRRAILPDFAADYTFLLFSIKGAKKFFEWRIAQLAQYAKQDDSKRTAEAALHLWNETKVKFDELVGIETPDDRTLIVHLENPTAYFLDLCAFMTFAPVHEASIRQYEIGPSASGGEFEQDVKYFEPGNLVGNGPYVLARRRPRRDLLLLGNEHFWNRKAIGNHSVYFKIIENPQTALWSYRHGEADWWPDMIPDSVAADLIEAGVPHIHPQMAAATYYLIFNCNPKLPDGKTDNPFHDPRVRRAFSMAVNREKIVKSVTRLNQPVALSFVPPKVFAGYDPPIEAGVSYHPQNARKLLVEAGYGGGEGLPVIELLVNSNSGHEPTFEQIANTWEQELGVDTELVIKETKIFGNDRNNQNFMIARGGWFGDYTDPTTFLNMYVTGDGNNDGRFSNPDYDRLLDEATRQSDSVQRMQTLRGAETILMELQGIAPIFHYIDLQMFDPSRVEQIHLNPLKFRRIDMIKVRPPQDGPGSTALSEPRPTTH